jgi:aminoglycoside phosphotransferase (APT) family kinase protein
MTPAVHDVLPQDPALPQRDLLLDGDAMARRLPALLGTGAIDGCRPVRARYQLGRSLRVLYRVTEGESARLVALRTFAGKRSEEVYRRAAATAAPSGSSRGVAHDPELGAVLFAFPNDRKVAGLSALVDGPRSRLVAYAPEKCATARVLDPDGRTIAFAKAYAGDDGRRTRQIHDSLQAGAARARLRLPRATSYDPDTRTLVCEAVEGRRLADLDGAERTDGFSRLGGALAALHGLDPPPAAPAFERLDPEQLRLAAETVERARPDCAEAVRELLARLLASAPAPTAAVCLHGDVHPKNALVANGGAALIDLDQASVGPAAADLASVLAALRYARLVGELSSHEERAQGEAFQAGYAAVRGLPDAASLRWHVSAALLAERAVRAITRLRLNGLARLPELLIQANAMLERSP